LKGWKAGGGKAGGGKAGRREGGKAAGRRWGTGSRRWYLAVLAGVNIGFLAGCERTHKSEGETLARTYCAACHSFPEPQLLDKNTWQSGVLPQMAQRLGIGTQSLAEAMSRNPLMTVLPVKVSEQDWEKIVAFYLAGAPAKLPDQTLPAQPQLDPPFFRPQPFATNMKSSGITTLLKIDSTHQRIFIGDAGANTLSIFDFERHLLSTVTLGSPPTDLIVNGDTVLVLESGILNPNDQPRGSVVRYDFTGHSSLRSPVVMIDSLYRPVFFQQFDFDGDGRNEVLICEFGDNRGRLALYKYDGARYQRHVLDSTPGAIRFELHDMNGDGSPDIVALFAQADERIELLENDGKGNFSGERRILARFPPVYGSMYFSMHDFNGDGRLDILYVNGDNFDYSRILKPYHGIRILENDGKNNFKERYFFPIYGAAQAVVADFDRDGDLDIMTASNFADPEKSPERGIMYFENDGQYKFRPYAFSAASGNQWNVMAAGDLNNDGWPDVIVGAMDLGSIAKFQRQYSASGLATAKDPVLFFENALHPAVNQGAH
jgi:hypothetical protein